MSPSTPRQKLPFGDRSTARRTGLPAPTAYLVDTVRIAMRDGITLGASLYSPVVLSKGVLLTRGPYGRSPMMAQMAASVWAAQGYTVLFVSSRGTADSEGDFDPMRTEVEDGQDVLVWLRAQEWYPGRFATVGGSYLGHTQWAMLSDPPDDLAAAVVLMGPHDFSRHAWGTGSFNLDFIGWAEQIALQDKGVVRAIIGMMTSARRLRPVLEATPLTRSAPAYFGDRAPWVRDRLERDDLSDRYWAPMQHADALEKVQVPVLILGGWQDIFLRQSIEQYRRLRERGIETALTIGPWTHIDLRGGAARTTNTETLAWLDAHLADSPKPVRRPRVHVFDKGVERWLELDDWPAASDLLTFHLRADGVLGVAPAPGRRSFRYDPADPTPTVGGNIIAGGGYVDDRSLAARGDTLVYDSAPLAEALAVRGAPVLEVEHSAEHPDADLFVRVSDVDDKGRSRNVTEGFVRLKGDAARAAVELPLLDTAYTFAAGHRVRLIVAGGSFPQYARNPGTGENPLAATVLEPNTHSVGAGTLTLPIDQRRSST